MLKTEPFVINMGPQHPSTHGVFRMVLTLDGEKVVDLVPVFGYLHRAFEKLGESCTYAQIIPYTDRMDYVSSMSNNFGYVLAVEKLAGIPVPERAEYIRVIMAELTRLSNHLLAVGTFTSDCGCSGTPLLYMFREREKILDMFDMTCGARLTCNYMRIGGVSQDLPDEFMPALKRLVDEMPARINQYDDLLAQNEILVARTRNTGLLPADLAIDAGISGPTLRGSGVKWDLRKDRPYSIYDRFDFDVPVGERGDCYDRYRVRVEEMRQSVRILEQAMKDVPGGPFRTPVPTVFYPPVGEAYGYVESPKGELGYYLVSDGMPSPWRYKVRSPSFINLTVLKEMIVGQKVADAVITLGSIDIVMGEVDR